MIPPVFLMQHTVKIDWMEGCDEPVMDLTVFTALGRFVRTRTDAGHHNTIYSISVEVQEISHAKSS